MYSIQDVLFGLSVYINNASGMKELHRHSDIQLGFFEKGPVRYQVGGQVYTVEAKEYVMLWSEVPHMLHSTPENNTQYWLTIPFPLFIKWNMPDELANKILSGKLVVVHDKNYCDIDRISFPQWQKDLQNTHSQFQELIIDTFEVRFRRFALMYNLQKIDADKNSYVDKSIFADIYGYLQKNFTKKISIEDIGDEFKIHPNYAMNIFKKKSGYTINQMINMMRIHEAQRLLISSDISITDIAYESGFSTISNFYAIFKKYCGITPTDYRNNPYHADLKSIINTEE